MSISNIIIIFFFFFFFGGGGGGGVKGAGVSLLCAYPFEYGDSLLAEPDRIEHIVVKY